MGKGLQTHTHIQRGSVIVRRQSVDVKSGKQRAIDGVRWCQRDWGAEGDRRGLWWSQMKGDSAVYDTIRIPLRARRTPCADGRRWLLEEGIRTRAETSWFSASAYLALKDQRWRFAGDHFFMVYLPLFYGKRANQCQEQPHSFIKPKPHQLAGY